MARRANVGSVASVQELLTALLNFWPRCQELLCEAQSAAARGVAELGEREQAWQRELRRRQEAADNADDDDRGYLAAQVEEAEEELRETKRSLRNAEDAQAEFNRCAAQVLGGQNDKAVSFLRRKIQEMQDYLSTQLGQRADVASPAQGRLHNRMIAAEGVYEAGVGTLTDYTLPATFDWVSLSAISPHELASLPADEEYQKASLAEMERGFFVLREEVLPTMQELGMRANATYFEAFDQQAGFAQAEGTQRVYEAFFGDDAIKLDRSGDGRHYEIINGRHRIRVALEQGWTHVPARLPRKD